MANSLESEAEEDEKKMENQYSSSAPNKSNLGLCTLRKKLEGACWSMESDNVSSWVFIRSVGLEGFHPILSTIKTKQALGLILNLHFEIA